MDEVEYGVVKWFDDRKKYSFLIVLGANGRPTGTELFFHYSDGYFLRAGATGPEFHTQTGTVVDGNVKYVTEPKEGSRLVFARGDNSKGERAGKWGYVLQYESILASRQT